MLYVLKTLAVLLSWCLPWHSIRTGHSCSTCVSAARTAPSLLQSFSSIELEDTGLRNEGWGSNGVETLRSTSRRLLEVVPVRSGQYSQNQVTEDEQGTSEPDQSTPETVTSSSESSTSLSPAPAASTVSTGAVLQQRDARAEDSGEKGIEPAGVAAAAIGSAVFIVLAVGAALMGLKRYYRGIPNSAHDRGVSSSQPPHKESNTLSTSLDDGPESSESKKLSNVRVTTDSAVDSLWGLSEVSTSLRVYSPRRVPPCVPEGVPCLKTIMQFIKQQLDCFGPDHLLLGRYQLLGSDQRRTGGQSVVQFARRTDGTGLAPYAVKFFLMRSVYDEEAAMYRNSPPQLKRFMPKVVKFVANVNDAIVDPFGNPLPPFIVMEKGDSLRDRTRDTPVDVFTAAQVLGHVSERIAELHDAGYAHRDLKPGNIMWQPRTYTWVLIDFGLAAALDGDAAVGFTPTYAAPEMVIAHLGGQRVIKADASVDAWALGVIAFELLVQRHPFGLLATKSKVFEELSDPKNPLPWESGRLSRKDKKKLGGFRKPIMKLLQRDPRKRATARDFCRDIRNIFTKHNDSTFRTDASDLNPSSNNTFAAGSIPSFALNLGPESKRVVYASPPASERSSKPPASLNNSPACRATSSDAPPVTLSPQSLPGDLRLGGVHVAATCERQSLASPSDKTNPKQAGAAHLQSGRNIGNGSPRALVRESSEQEAPGAPQEQDATAQKRMHSAYGEIEMQWPTQHWPLSQQSAVYVPE